MRMDLLTFVVVLLCSEERLPLSPATITLHSFTYLTGSSFAASVTYFTNEICCKLTS